MQIVKHSLSSKISFWVVLVAALGIAVMMGQLWRGWARAIRD